MGIAVAAVFMLPYAIQYFTHQYYGTEHRTAHKIENRLEDLIEKCFTENETLEQSIGQLSTLKEANKQWEFNKIVYKASVPVYWTSRHILPGYRDIQRNDSIFYYETNSWKYICVVTRKVVDDQKVSIVSTVPICFDPPIINEFIKSSYNTSVFDFASFDISAKEKEGYTPISYHKKGLFYVSFNHGYNIIPTLVSVALVLSVVVFVFLFIVFLKEILQYFVKSNAPAKGIFTIAGLLIFFRTIMVVFQYPGVFLSWSLFDAKNYASSDINPSLGDLLLNLIVILAVLFLINIFLTHLFKKRAIQKYFTSKKIHLLLICVTFLAAYIFWEVFFSLNRHSSWSYDIYDSTSLSYLRFVGLLIILVIGGIYFVINHLAGRLLMHFSERTNYIIIAATTFILVVALFWLQQDLTWVMAVHGLFLLVIIKLKLPRKTTTIQYTTFFYFIITALACAAYSYIAITQFKQSNLETKLSRMADQLMVDNDFYAEYLIEEASERISSDVFIQNRMFSPYSSKEIIVEKVKRVYLGSYFERYDASIVLYNAQGEPFSERNSPLPISEVKSIFRPYIINDNGLYFINSNQTNVPKRYLKIIEIKRYNQTAGYILLDLRLKKVIPNTLYPLLLADARFPVALNQAEYAYGIFSDGLLISSYGPLSYTNIYQESVDYETRNLMVWDSNGYEHHLFGNKDRKVIISVKKNQESQSLANFSFYFLLFCLGVLLVVLVNLSLGYRRGRLHNLATKIQIYLNLAFFIPLMVITISSISLISSIYRNNLEQEYIDKAMVLHDKISDALSIPLSEGMEQEYISNELVKMARFSETDINLFSMSGKLLATSQQAIFQADLISDFIEPEALYGINEHHVRYVVLEERIGTLSYKNIYMGIKSFETGDIVAIMNIPFFKAQKELSQQVINVFTRELNIFTFLFLLLFFISFILSRSLTSPLRLIGDQMRKLSFSTTNDPIAWKSDDEIGKLISTYNTMVRNLEESRKALARTEKESAWREMARQVAHEIKNPLTPMKLSLQHMQRIVSDSENGNLKNQIAALLNQVDTLSDIASSFSAFAKMPAPVADSFDFQVMLEKTVTAYQKNDIGQVLFNANIFGAQVNGDEKWLGRAISNIVINGLQAARDNVHPLLEVNLQQKSEHTLLLSIKDNGPGIPEDIQEKIFVPNFSTKSSGSGLGLAIAKKAVEHAGGKIWFETEADKGTIFYIELPILNVE